MDTSLESSAISISSVGRSKESFNSHRESIISSDSVSTAFDFEAFGAFDLYRNEKNESTIRSFNMLCSEFFNQLNIPFNILRVLRIIIPKPLSFSLLYELKIIFMSLHRHF